MQGQFHGKVALVTGAGSGIGRASAYAFAKEGAKVIVGDIDISSGEETMNTIKRGGSEAIFVKVDVSQSSEVEAMINTAIETYGHLDYAHNNAGIMERREMFTNINEDVFDHIIAVNLRSIFLCMKYELIQMVKNGNGSIVNTASIAGLRGTPLRPIYTASKHGVIGLTKSGALEYAKTGIRINAVCPGVTKSNMSRQTSKKAAKMLAERVMQIQPMGRMAEAEEIAEAVIWLCSEKASFITGSILTIDGGWTAQ